MKKWLCVCWLPAAALLNSFPSEKYLKEKKTVIFRFDEEKSHQGDTGF